MKRVKIETGNPEIILLGRLFHHTEPVANPPREIGTLLCRTPSLPEFLETAVPEARQHAANVQSR
jgi:hypothetical protein